MKRFWAILFWSIIPAAFIGPGTVTTAAAVGAEHGLVLLWALTFSVVATIALTEAAARLTIVSGRNLAEAIREQFRGHRSSLLVLLLVLGAIVVGNAAYQAGNVLGAVAGVTLGLDVSPRLVTLAIGLVAALLLWVGTPRFVAYALSITVATMGFAFLMTALLIGPDPAELTLSLLLPRLPSGSVLLVLALVGTTVVPYNLFLGSGLAGGHKLSDVRFGLVVAVIIGGVISMSVVVVGTAVEPPLSFEGLFDALARGLGPWTGYLLATGLFAAGFSSATTAPLAAAITARGLFEDGSGRWGNRSARYRLVWSGVLLVGVGFGLAGVRPIPAIILAQALNGVLLPFAAIFLLVAVNDRRLMGADGLNGTVSNIVMTSVTAIAVALGSTGVLRAGYAAANAGTAPATVVVSVSVATMIVLAFPVLRIVRARRDASRV